MVERAVADVLQQVLAGPQERFHPDPLRALVAHLRQPGYFADRVRLHHQHQRVAADAAADHRAGRYLGRAVVRAAGAEVRRARDQRQLRHPTGFCADQVRVPQRVRRAVHSGRLAVPEAGDAGHPRVLVPGHQLGPLHRGRGELLVHRRAEHDVVLGQQLLAPLQLQVQAGQRRSLVARDERRGVQALSPVGPAHVDDQANQRLHPGQRDRPEPAAKRSLIVAEAVRVMRTPRVGTPLAPPASLDARPES